MAESGIHQTGLLKPSESNKQNYKDGETPSYYVGKYKGIKAIDIIFDFVRKNFTQQITLDEISGKVSMTVPAFCRYFKKVTGKSFTQFLIDFRIINVTKLLTENHTDITEI